MVNQEQDSRSATDGSSVTLDSATTLPLVAER